MGFLGYFQGGGVSSKGASHGSWVVVAVGEWWAFLSTIWSCVWHVTISFTI